MKDTHRICKTCLKPYCIKPKGYNSLYCSGKCKNRSRRNNPNFKLTRVKSRKRRYERILLDPVRYQKHLQQGSRSRAKVQAWLAEYKASRGCIDCGYSKHSSALQLDHTGVKTREIADCRSSIRGLQEEISKGKCVVRCANCHSIKTWAERNKLVYHPHGDPYEFPKIPQSPEDVED